VLFIDWCNASYTRFTRRIRLRRWKSCTPRTYVTLALLSRNNRTWNYKLKYLWHKQEECYKHHVTQWPITMKMNPLRLHGDNMAHHITSHHTFTISKLYCHSHIIISHHITITFHTENVQLILTTGALSLSSPAFGWCLMWLSTTKRPNRSSSIGSTVSRTTHKMSKRDKIGSVRST